jgi:arylsulfatase A-like enzyme
MKAIMVMFDSLNRHHLPPYGCDWTHAPNFQRLAKRTVTFDRSYVCSMPCMPARRDLHTGRSNFLHRAWGPLEPFDDSMPQILKDNGIHTHLASDHQHYWEDGGATYHTRYSTWEFFRGQEGDPCIGHVKDPVVPPNLNADRKATARQDWINRSFMREEHQMPQSKTFAAGRDFIRRNHDQDNWFLQIETFDPHEPFVSPRKYKDLYSPDHPDRPIFDWPPYCELKTEPPEQIQQVREEYAALLSMCDSNLGDVLDLMDELDLWKDTMLIVWTDHGFMLGEHRCWAKMWMPMYEEIGHTPFFVWDPRSKKQGERRASLVQPSIDLAPTLLDYFGLKPTPNMRGKVLRDAVANDTPVRDAALFGYHGKYVNVTDGRYVYMRDFTTEENEPLYEYTLMPTRMRARMSLDELKTAQLHPPLEFTKGVPVLRIGKEPDEEIRPRGDTKHLLFDLQNDPGQDKPLNDSAVEKKMIDYMMRLMREHDAPAEQFVRMGLARDLTPSPSGRGPG